MDETKVPTCVVAQPRRSLRYEVVELTFVRVRADGQKEIEDKAAHYYVHRTIHC